jgi:hypothetical protein
LFREALPLAEEHGDLITRSEIHRHIGFYHLVDEKNYDEALRYLRISLEMRRQHGDPRWIPSGTLALGQAYVMAGRPAEAMEYFRAALDESRAAGLHRRRVEQAETWLTRVEATARPTG